MRFVLAAVGDLGGLRSSPPFGQHEVVEPSPELLTSLQRLGILEPAARRPPMTALTGGVSSEIWHIDLAGGPLVAKRALPQLRVAGVWRAPVERTGYEVAWMRRAEAIVPGISPGVVAADGQAFVMRYLAPTEHPLWKQQLLAGHADPTVAGRLGVALATIHAATAGDASTRAEFDNLAMFAALRLDPYLDATAGAHPDRAAELAAVRAEYESHRQALVHGDVSPKNVLVGPRGPVLLDAECATWGDPAFDLAFCTSHLLLKCRAVPEATDGFLDCAAALVSGYIAGVTWEEPAPLDARCARLVGALLLARVDGLSPVEYLDEPARAGVRDAARRMLVDPPATLAELCRRWT
jgi:aminoglycoside phosphotransferase (APT) family kinase protein